ncbi:MAG: hypothetical protein J7J28_05030 [Thaumarchaeota archaeon]|nr:hypothetical protein [Nitrososphaerota archaeon]
MKPAAQPTHSQCMNYRDGFCTLHGIPVPPDGPACPNFTPRTAFPGMAPPQTYSPPVPQPISMGAWIGWRRALRRMRRMQRRMRRGWRW